MNNYSPDDTEQVQHIKHTLEKAEILFKEGKIEEADEVVQEAEEYLIDYIANSDYGILATMSQKLQKARTHIANAEGVNDDECE